MDSVIVSQTPLTVNGYYSNILNECYISKLANFFFCSTTFFNTRVTMCFSGTAKTQLHKTQQGIQRKISRGEITQNGAE